MRGNLHGGLAAEITEILRKLRSGGSIDKSEIERLMAEASSLEDQNLKRHLLTTIPSLGKEGRGESDILGKLLSYDSSEFLKIFDALQEFSYENPFDELEPKEVFNFWRLVLRNLIKERRTTRSSTP